MTDNEQTNEPTVEPESGWRLPATDDTEAEGHGIRGARPATDEPSMDPDDGWRLPATEPTDDDEVEGHKKA